MNLYGIGHNTHGGELSIILREVQKSKKTIERKNDSKSMFKKKQNAELCTKY